MNRIRTLLVDDHKTFRQGLRSLFMAVSDIDVIHDVSTTGAVEASRAAAPQLIVLEPASSNGEGWHVLRHLCEGRRRVAVVVLTRLRDRVYLTGAMRAGALGYVLKDTGFEELHLAVQAAARGERHVDAMLEPPGRRAIDGAVDARLSEREGTVMRAAALGHSNIEIAALLGITVKTVEQHKQNGMSRLGLTRRAELVRYALVSGWLRDA